MKKKYRLNFTAKATAYVDVIAENEDEAWELSNSASLRSMEFDLDIWSIEGTDAEILEIIPDPKDLKDEPYENQISFEDIGN